MAELLIRVTDKVNDDFYLNTKCTKRGDVIHAAPNGWPWGKEELRLPFYRIVRLPGLSLSQARAFLAPEIDIDPVNPSRTLQLRSFKFDLDSAEIPADIRAWIADDSRATPMLTITNDRLPASLILSGLRKAKPAIADPAVIGNLSSVIG